MFVIRNGGVRLVATFQNSTPAITAKTGVLVDLSQGVGADLVATPHVGTANTTVKPDGIAYRDPTHYTRLGLATGAVGFTADALATGNVVDVVCGEFWGLTDFVENGDYPHGQKVGPSENGKLTPVAADAAYAIGYVLRGATVTNGDKAVDILFHIPAA